MKDQPVPFGQLAGKRRRMEGEMETISMTNEVRFSKIVAGFMRVIDSGLSPKEVLAHVHECLEMGVTTFDHADVYGNYHCEGFFGQAVLAKEPSLRGKMQLVTKGGIVLPGYRGNEVLYYDTTKEYLMAECERSLRELHTDHVDVFLVHRPDPLMNYEELAQTLDEIVASGKARAVGVSNFEPSQLRALQAFMKNPIATNQVELSVFAVDNLFNGVTDLALEQGMPLMIWSPVAGGRLFSGEDEKSVRIREAAGQVAEAHGVPLEEVLYAWVNACAGRLCPIVGSFKIERIKTAKKAMEIPLTRPQWFELLQASRGYPVP